MNKNSGFCSVGVVFVVLLFTLWAPSSSAMPLALNATLSPVSTGPYAAGDTVVVAVSTSDSVSFNSLDAQITWDPNLLVPLNMTVSLQPSGIFTNTFVSTSPTDPPFYALIMDSSPDQIPVNGPGELFRLTFQVKTGVALPASTSIGFVPLDQAGGTYDGNGLALTYFIYDQDGNYVDTLIYAATPPELAIAFQQQQAPEPASLSLALAALGLVVSFSRKALLPKNR